MKILPRTFALVFLPLGISAASAKPLNDKEVRDAAARIDSLVEKDLGAAGLKPNGRIDDGTFVRRAYLGIIGRIPTEEEVQEFFDDRSAGKRAELIDSLVASPGFDSHLFNWTADLLRLQTNQEQFGLGWHVWLRKSLAEDKPWDVMVREMLGSTGHAAKDPAVGYYLRDRNMQLDNFSNTMQVFLGRQIGCAQCHDHPFDDWSQFEYYQMAAFGGGMVYRSKEAQDTGLRVAKDLGEVVRTGGVKRNGKKNGKPFRMRTRKGGVVQKTLKPLFQDFAKNAVYEEPRKSLTLPDDYQYKDAAPGDEVDPETLFGAHLENVSPSERKEAFAKWVTSPENPFFTKVIANRMWARVFGHGLLEPIDDWSEDSKPVHPEVLAFLEKTMKAADYDLRQFSRVLFQTNLFQRECETVEAEPGVARLVRGPALRRMSAEQLYDSMLVLTRGNVDDGPSRKQEYEWAAYKQAVENLLGAESKDLMVLGESAAQAEAAYREAQSEGRRLRTKMLTVDSVTERRKIQAAMRDVRERAEEYKRARNPVAMMSNSMEMEMTSEMGESMKGGRRDRSERTVNRASEHPAPFKAGTLVREFGGSDRTVPSSGDTIPTVPQALALLNDPQTDILGGRRSPLRQRLSAAGTAGGKLDAIFLRLYSRYPTPEEKEKFQTLAKDDTSLRDLTRAMLTSNRFIFVQ